MSQSSTMSDRRVVLITGMSRGFGESVASAFWQVGADIFGTARNLAALSAVAKRLSAAPVRAGQRIVVANADLADPLAPRKLIRQCQEQLGDLDVLVSSAAIQGPIGVFWEQDAAAWEETLAIDLVASMRLAHTAVPVMLRDRAHPRSILFLSGGGATGPRPRFSCYAAAKTALVRFAETLAAELKDEMISVNSIAPGMMPTSMLAEVAAAGANRAGAGEIAAFERARATGDEVMQRAAALAVFLATTGSGITGKLIAAQWDRWEDWPRHLDELNASDVYTLRRITGRDRDMEWGDK